MGTSSGLPRSPAPTEAQPCHTRCAEGRGRIHASSHARSFVKRDYWALRGCKSSEQQFSASWLVMTNKAKEEGCLWFICRLTLVFIVGPGIALAVAIPIAEYVEDKWGQCVNVRIAAWMNSVTPAWRGREEWPVSEECKNAVMPWE